MYARQAGFGGQPINHLGRTLRVELRQTSQALSAGQPQEYDGRDSGGVDRVFTLDGLALGSPESIGVRAPAESVTPISPMRLSEFRARINRALVETGRQ